MSPGRHLAVVPFLLFAAAAFAQQTNNPELRAVPAPPKVAVDGNLDDWDLSGKILICPDVAALLDRYAVRASAMYDADYLYLAFQFTDASPMGNRVNPRSDPGGGWRADSIELRLETDQIVNVQAWYYTDQQQPTVWIGYGLANGPPFNPVIDEALEAGAKEGFRKDADGQGYVQELALPWKLLYKSGQAPTKGGSLRMGIQVNWGDASGGLATGMPSFRFEDLINPEHPQRSFFWRAREAWGTVRLLAHGDLDPSPSLALLDQAEQLRLQRYATVGPVPIAYDLPADGFVTLVVETLDGTRLRNLIADYPRRAGANTDYWDGRDDDGRLVATGTFRVRGLWHQAFDVTWEFAFGTPNPMPFAGADGRGGWLSNHANHMAALADDAHIYVSAPHTEGPYPVIALDYEGNKVWGGLARWRAGFMARHGDYLYVVNDPDVSPASDPKDLKSAAAIELIQLDPATGLEIPWPDRNSKHKIAEWSVAEQGTARQWEGSTVQDQAHDADWAGCNAQGLAALGDRLYLSLHYQDKLLVIDPAVGQAVGEIPVADPAGIASDGRRLLVISGRRVVALDPASGQTTPFVTTNLAAPIDLALDSRGRLYVSDWADQMCVKVFNPDGTYLKTIGKPGGRPWVGDYDPTGMLLPRGITIDARDRLWVAEFDFSPRRISCWNTDNGDLVLEKLGKGRYGGMGYYVLPDQPDRGIYMNNLVELDWEQGRWRVLSTLWRATRENESIGADPYLRFGRILEHGGRRYLAHGMARPQGGPTVISELRAGRAIPVAAIGDCVSAILSKSAQQAGGQDPDPVFAKHLYSESQVQAAAERLYPWFFHGPLAGDTRAVAYPQGRASIWRQAVKLDRELGRKQPKSQGSPNLNFLWSDLNGDALVQDSEMHYVATPGLEGPLPQKWCTETWANGVIDDDFTLYVSAIQDGRAYHYRVPVSRWTEAGAPVYEPADIRLLAESPYMGQAARIIGGGNLLTLGNIPSGTRPGGRRDPLVVYRPDGSIAWTYPSPWTGVHGSHTAPKEKRGLLIGPLGVAGDATLPEVGGIFAFHTNVGTADIFTNDGLFVGRLFRDGRSAPEPWPDLPRRGVSLNNMSNGGEWFGGQFFQRPDGRIFVVCSREAGVIAEVHGLDTVRRFADREIAFTAEHYAIAAAQEAPRPGETGPPSVKLPHLAPPAATPPPLNAFAWTTSTKAAWRYDETRAAEAAIMVDANHLHVAFKVEDDTPMINRGEDVRRLFKFGDAAILELRTDPMQVGKGVAPGDLRLLFSVHQGKPVAVLYDYRRPGAGEPVELTSVKTTRIERLEVLENAKMAIDRDDGGYVLRASVPLADLKWTPVPGTVYPGDFGIVYSDQTGQTNQLRMYWSNRATGIVSDLSMEADIQPGNWGRFEVLGK